LLLLDNNFQSVRVGSGLGSICLTRFQLWYSVYEYIPYKYVPASLWLESRSTSRWKKWRTNKTDVRDVFRQSQTLNLRLGWFDPGDITTDWADCLVWMYACTGSRESIVSGEKWHLHRRWTTVGRAWATRRRTTVHGQTAAQAVSRCSSSAKMWCSPACPPSSPPGWYSTLCRWSCSCHGQCGAGRPAGTWRRWRLPTVCHWSPSRLTTGSRTAGSAYRCAQLQAINYTVYTVDLFNCLGVVFLIVKRCRSGLCRRRYTTVFDWLIDWLTVLIALLCAFPVLKVVLDSNCFISHQLSILNTDTRQKNRQKYTRRSWHET